MSSQPRLDPKPDCHQCKIQKVVVGLEHSAIVSDLAILKFQRLNNATRIKFYNLSKVSFAGHIG
jgi:hypothetical protein